MDHFKVFIEFVTVLLLFHISVFWPWGMWDLGALTEDGTHTLLKVKSSHEALPGSHNILKILLFR